MITKTIIIGQTDNETPIKKPIEFVHCLGKYDRKILNKSALALPNTWHYIELICKDYDGMDLMFAYNNPEKRKKGYLYIGYWNDGVVE